MNFSKEVQPSKHETLILVTEEGVSNLNFFKFVHWKKANPQIDETEEGIEISFIKGL